MVRQVQVEKVKAMSLTSSSGEEKNKDNVTKEETSMNPTTSNGLLYEDLGAEEVAGTDDYDLAQCAKPTTSVGDAENKDGVLLLTNLDPTSELSRYLFRRNSREG